MNAANRPEWSDVTAAGIFRIPTMGGHFDLHFHDCDEYWLVFSGKAKVRQKGFEFFVQRGDILCTHAGDEHDVLEVYETLEAFYFEGPTPPGGRIGHLHRESAHAAGHDVPHFPVPTTSLQKVRNDGTWATPLHLGRHRRLGRRLVSALFASVNRYRQGHPSRGGGCERDPPRQCPRTSEAAGERLYTNIEQAFDANPADFAVVVVPPRFPRVVVDSHFGTAPHPFREAIARSWKACVRIYHKVCGADSKEAVTMSHRFDQDKANLEAADQERRLRRPELFGPSIYG